MLSTAVMAGFGFIFWIIAARAYPPEQVGYATALISVTILLSNLSLLGFNSSLIRYLPKATNPNLTINTSIITVGIATIVISGGYLVGIDHFGPAFKQLAHNPTFASLFLIFMVMVSVNTLTDSVFIAYRSSKYNFLTYLYFGLTKICLPLLLVRFAAYGVFFSYTGAVTVSLILSFYFMVKHFKYKFRWTFEKATTAQMAKFSLANYLATFLSGFPILIMPTLIIGKLGAPSAAYYYMATTIVGLLYIVPQATTQSLFAEGSNNENEIMAFVKSAAKLITMLTLPCGIVIILLGRYILLVFGRSYAQHSFQLLEIMVLTGVFLSANLIGSAIMKVRHQIMELIYVNIGYLIATMILAVLLLKYGLLGIGWALFGGQVFVCLEYLWILPKLLHGTQEKRTV